MISLDPLSWINDAFLAEDSPRQLAAGFAFGLAIGLIPKGNLTAQFLLFALAASQANMASALLSAFLFSWAGWAADPLANRIGLALLRWPALAPLWTRLYNAPVMPWTAFNNSAVLGNLVLAVLLAWPAYRLTLPHFTRWAPLLADKLKKIKSSRLLKIAEKAARIKTS